MFYVLINFLIGSFDIKNEHVWLQIINEKPQVIQEYESGKAIPNQQIIGKLERALGAKLRGKKWENKFDGCVRSWIYFVEANLTAVM